VLPQDSASQIGEQKFQEDEDHTYGLINNKHKNSEIVIDNSFCGQSINSHNSLNPKFYEHDTLRETTPQMKKEYENSVFSTELNTTPSNVGRNQSPPFKILNNSVEPISKKEA